MTNMQAIPDICDGRILFYRERASGIYSTGVYFSVFNVTYIPLIVLQALAYSPTFYYMVGLKDDLWSFAYFLLLVYLVEFAGFMLMQLIAAASPTTEVALGTLALPITLIMYFSGFAPKLDDLPSGWAWATDVTFTRWAFVGFMANEFEDSGCWYETESNTTDASITSPTTQDCYTGDDVLDEYSFDEPGRLPILPIQLCFIWVQGLMVYLCLRYVIWKSR
eukprot:Rmarinus@m.23189